MAILKQKQIELPLRDALVSAHDRVLDVYRVVAHPPQHQGLIQSSDHENCVVEITIRTDGLRAPKESEVSRPGVHLAGAAGHQAHVEVVLVRGLVAVDRKVAAGVVGTLHPYLFI